MTCQNKTASKGDKGSGTKLFIDFNSCTHVADPNADPLTLDVATDNAYTAVPCMTEITPPGGERAEEQDDGCLETDVSVADVGPLSLSSSTFTVRYVPGDAVDVALKAALKDGLDKSIVIKHPVGSTFAYEWYDGKISQVQPQSITKRGFRTATVRITPQSESGITATAADLGTGLT